MQGMYQAFFEDFFDLNFYSANVAFLVCTVILLGRFNRKPTTIVRRVLDLAALITTDIFIEFVLFSLLGTPLASLVLAVLLGIYAALQRQIRNTDKVARAAAFFASFILLTGITGLAEPVMQYFGGIFSFGAMANLVSFALLLVVALFLRHYAVSRFRYVPSSYVYLVAVICIIASVAGWSFIRFASDTMNLVQTDNAVSHVLNEASIVNLIVDVGFLSLVLISYRLFYMLSSEHDHRAERLVTKRSASSNQEMIEVTRSVYESMREMRHEMKNRNAYMTSLAAAGQWDRLSEYINSFTESAGEVLNYVQSGNSTIDAIVNAKIALANSRGIDVKTMLAVPQDLSFSDEDLYTLIANLMDNAIEGAMECGREPKTIKLSMRPTADYYIISVQNPCSERPDATGPISRLKTTKEDKEIHGYGTKVIARITRRNRGMARYFVKDNVFLVSVMLANPDAKAKGA